MITSKRTARIALILCVAFVAGCGQQANVYTGNLSTYVVGLDQLSTSGFAVLDATHTVSASALASGVNGSTQSGGCNEGAQARYFRSVPDFATSNGPVDVISTVVRRDSPPQAHDMYLRVVSALDAEQNAVTISTGPLGDEAHATSRLAQVESVSAIEISLAWRIGNLLNRITIRGRYGGARLEDALTLAQTQTNNEQNGGRPTPSATARPTSTPHATASP